MARTNAGHDPTLTLRLASDAKTAPHAATETERLSKSLCLVARKQ